MDEDLRKEIDQLVGSIAGLRILLDHEAAPLLKALKSAFVGDEKSVWWWESLKVPCRSIEYDSEKSLDSLKSLLSEKGDILLLAVTNDDPPPWKVVEGRLDDLLEFVGELRYFEYFVTDASAAWIVFDTHHNQFVISDATASQ